MRVGGGTGPRHWDFLPRRLGKGWHQILRLAGAWPAVKLQELLVGQDTRFWASWAARSILFPGM